HSVPTRRSSDLSFRKRYLCCANFQFSSTSYVLNDTFRKMVYEYTAINRLAVSGHALFPAQSSPEYKGSREKQLIDGNVFGRQCSCENFYMRCRHIAIFAFAMDMLGMRQFTRQLLA